jgi:hypothetical protein
LEILGYNIAALLSLFVQLLSHSLCFIILLALSYVPISTASFFSIISSFTSSPRTPFPVIYVNPRALLIAVPLFVSSAGGLWPKDLQIPELQYSSGGEFLWRWKSRCFRVSSLVASHRLGVVVCR